MQTLKLVRAGKVCESGTQYRSPAEVYGLLHNMSRLDREHFVVLHLDVKNRVTAKETVSIGSLNQSIVHPREVFKAAVHNGSAAIICVHNHPSGDPKPSTEDKTITKRLSEVAGLLGIPILDHIIIGHGTYYSFAESTDSGFLMGKRLVTNA